jgi:Bacterial Ig domain
MQRRFARPWLLAAGLALAACGGDDASTTTTGAAMDSAPKPPQEQKTAALNSAPVIQAVVIEPRDPRPGDEVTARVTASDPDGDPVQLEYDWIVDGHNTGESGASFRVSGAAKDSYIEVRVIASDGTAQSLPESASVRVGNQPPLMQGIVIEPLGEVTAGHDVIASPRATDPDGDPISYHFRWDVNGTTMPETGPTLAATNYHRGDKIVVTVVATDGNDESEPLRSDPITVVNAAPKITSTPGNIDDDGVFRYKVTAEDPDGDRGFRYRLVQGPKGMNLDVVDGALTWAPAPDQAGKNPVQIEVADIHGGKATQSFVVNVAFEDEKAPDAQAAAQKGASAQAPARKAPAPPAAEE